MKYIKKMIAHETVKNDNPWNTVKNYNPWNITLKIWKPNKYSKEIYMKYMKYKQQKNAYPWIQY